MVCGPTRRRGQGAVGGLRSEIRYSEMTIGVNSNDMAWNFAGEDQTSARKNTAVQRRDDQSHKREDPSTNLKVPVRIATAEVSECAAQAVRDGPREGMHYLRMETFVRLKTPLPSGYQEFSKTFSVKEFEDAWNIDVQIISDPAAVRLFPVKDMCHGFSENEASIMNIISCKISNRGTEGIRAVSASFDAHPLIEISHRFHDASSLSLSDRAIQMYDQAHRAPIEIVWAIRPSNAGFYFHIYTFDQNQMLAPDPTRLPFPELSPELMNFLSGDSIGFRYTSGLNITLSSDGPGRYRLSTSSPEAAWIPLRDLRARLKLACIIASETEEFRFEVSSPLPLEECFAVVDQHMKAILEDTFRKLTAASRCYLEHEDALEIAGCRVGCMIRLLLDLLGLEQERYHVVESVLSLNNVVSSWEETTHAGIAYYLRSLSGRPKEFSGGSKFDVPTSNFARV
ncbi:hypothetical protein BDK51DRAFT_28005 [Blyttiomyces helicus]|uniref:Uncharacterized protein n=1 Tax=Blyttiomyces helicus TaxID=388810 RepID=A0A4P9WE95_9FUNG|nr:hypothetical protein BDK51DRAFT_28005 [Blyttiomyces helicus]|eukprot:RKO89578.1 hypothetical protein BDK51DRAFT_28005 [Blyttiomyces helicus]